MTEVEEKNEFYLGPNDLVFGGTKDGIYGGGFDLKSAVLKAGMSPIQTVNDQMGGSGLVSDMFSGLVIPNWALSYNKYGGKKFKEEDDADEDNYIKDDLHDRLLDLVMIKENDMKASDMKASDMKASDMKASDMKAHKKHKKTKKHNVKISNKKTTRKISK